MPEGTEARFLRYVNKSGPCWLWTGAKCSGGYGVFQLDNRAQSAHRVAYSLFVGPIPEGKDLLHSCDIPACVRPDHLRPGTDLENNHDMIAKGRRRFGQMPNRKGSSNDNAKLTEGDVLAIRADLRPRAVIAKHYSITHGHVRHIQARIAWRHV